MNNFDSTRTELSKLLDEIIVGKIQLPEFQRPWVWDDERIRSLLVSVARSFPIGAVMLLETGSKDIKFQPRPVTSVNLPAGTPAERLILDGQQRLTALTQVLKLTGPVLTADDKGREIRQYYYIDIEKAVTGPAALEQAIFAVREDRTVRTNFGRDIVLDLRAPEKEYDAFCFPCSRILKSDAWGFGCFRAHPERIALYMQFSEQVLDTFKQYLVPVIEMKKDTPREAVCLVFEKVNTGGVQLKPFDLVTAMYASETYNLREDWFGDRDNKGRQAQIATRALLKETDGTEFLQGISLLYSYERRQEDIGAGKTGKEVTGVTAKREHILATPLDAYKKWADRLTKGFLEADHFLRHLGFYHPKFLPYRAQVIPLAAVLTHIGDRWLEPQIQEKLTQWYWCGVFGELYGSASETRIALDFQELMKWIANADAFLPSTIAAAGFQPSRLETMRSRTSAAYRGLYVLLQREGAEDFFWKARIVDLDHNQKRLDIHHIFPRKWCEAHGVPPRIYDSIINKTAISYKANRTIGGSAPSAYLEQLENHKAVRLAPKQMDAILRTHCIDPALLRSDDFDGFFRDRKATLLALVERAMGKQAIVTSEPPIEDASESELEIAQPAIA
jgi:hypothetical protein